MAAFLSAAQLTILVPEVLHLLAFAQEHFRYGLQADLRCGGYQGRLRAECILKLWLLAEAYGGTLGFVNFLFPLHDMTIEDITPSFVSYSDGFSQLTDGTVDAALALSGYPAGAVMQAAAGAELRFISFSDGMLDTALEANGAYIAVDIAADVYGMEAGGTVIGVNNMLIAPNSLDAATVQAVTAAIFDNLAELQEENANARQIDPAMSLKLAIPLHAGAQAYFDSK